MREPLVIRPQESAIGNVFDEALKGYQAHPGYEASYKGMLAAAIKQKLLQAQQSQQAQLNQQSALAKIFSQHMGEDPNAPTAAELTAAAMVGPGTTKDMGDQFRNAYQTALATGDSDAMRRSMVMGGHSIDQNFAPTGADAAAIQNRNAWNVPLTDAQVKGNYTQALWDKLSPRQQATIIDANKSGMNLSMGPDGTTTMTSGGPGTFQPGDFGAPAAGGKNPSPLGPLQGATMATMQGKTLQNQALIDQLMDHAKLIAAAKDSDFGPAGKAQVLAGDAATNAKGLADLIGSMGYKGSAAFSEQAKAAALKNGANPDTINQIFSGNPNIMRMEYSAAALRGPVAQYLAGVDGHRAAQGEYLKEADDIVEDPTKLGAGKVRSMQALQTLVHGLSINQNANSGARLPIDDIAESIMPGNVPTAAPVVNQPFAVPTAPVPTGPISAPVATNAPDGGSSVTVAQPIATLSQPTAPVPSAPMPPIDAPDGSHAKPFKPLSADDYSKLPDNSSYLDPMGNIRTKPGANTLVPNGPPPVGSVPLTQGGY